MMRYTTYVVVLVLLGSSAREAVAQKVSWYSDKDVTYPFPDTAGKIFYKGTCAPPQGYTVKTAKITFWIDGGSVSTLDLVDNKLINVNNGQFPWVNAQWADAAVVVSSPGSTYKIAITATYTNGTITTVPYQNSQTVITKK